MAHTKPLADFSPERRATALSWIRGEGLLTRPGLTYEARLLAAVGLLVCDDAGRIAETDLHLAMADDSIIQAARSILREASN